jgi:MFS family permease
MSVGFMAAFPLVGALVQAWGWRSAWFSVGFTLVIALAPLAWVLVRRAPEELGLVPDGDGLRESKTNPNRRESDSNGGLSWLEALATSAFWVFAAGTAMYGLVASGISLFNESILAQRGFGADTYYLTLVVTAFTALAGNFGGGWLASRTKPGNLMAASMFLLAAGLALLPHVATTVQVMAWATIMGLGGGFVMVLFFSVWPRLFGRRALGRIQGSAQAVTVLASALGPVLLAWCIEWTGSYEAMFRILAAVIAAVGLAALVVPAPARTPDSRL